MERIPNCGLNEMFTPLKFGTNYFARKIASSVIFPQLSISRDLDKLQPSSV